MTTYDEIAQLLHRRPQPMRRVLNQFIRLLRHKPLSSQTQPLASAPAIALNEHTQHAPRS